MCIVHYIVRVPEYLGEFEQLILLALARLGDAAYGVTIRQTLAAVEGNREVAASILGIGVATLYRRLREMEEGSDAAPPAGEQPA